MQCEKQTTSFSSTVRCVIPKNVDSFLSVASLESLKKLMPIGVSSHSDLIPIAFNACVVNRVNKNGDVISTETALKIFKDFIHKPINLDHNRMDIVGHIINAGLSKFSESFYFGEGSELIDEKDATDDPFNISLAGYLYLVSPAVDLVKDYLLESNDPSSQNYLSFSASWELGFDEYSLAIGSKNLKECEIISDEEEIRKIEFNQSGKNNRLPDGRYIYRMVHGNVVPLGIGLTSNPAADVRGIVVVNETVKEESEPTEVKEEEMTFPENANILAEKGVKQCNDNNIHMNTEPEIKDIGSWDEFNALTQEQLPAYSVASLKTVVDEAMNKSIADLNARIESEKLEKEQVVAEKAKLLAKVEEGQKAIDELKAELEKITIEQLSIKKEQAFQQRMSAAHEEFHPSDEVSKIIASKASELNDEDYSNWLSEFRVLVAAQAKNQLSQDVVQTERATSVASQQSVPNITENIARKTERAFTVSVKTNNRS